MIKLILELITATVVAIVLGLVEAACAIPCAIKDYYTSCVVPAFKDIIQDYKDRK